MSIDFGINGVKELIDKLNELVRPVLWFEVPEPASPQQDPTRPFGESRGELGAEAFADGFPAFDMKPGLLRSPRAKIGKHGQRYIDVPMMHKGSVTGQPDIRRLSAPWKDGKGRQHGTAAYKWIHPGVKSQGGEQENAPWPPPPIPKAPPPTDAEAETTAPGAPPTAPGAPPTAPGAPPTAPEVTAKKPTKKQVDKAVVEAVDKAVGQVIELGPEATHGLLLLLSFSLREVDLRNLK